MPRRSATTKSPPSFLQTAVPAGFAERLGREVFEELGAIDEGAIRRLLASLPAGFPTAVSDGIAGGLCRHLKALQEPT